jgi:ethanolamine transporter EutH
MTSIIILTISFLAALILKLTKTDKVGLYKFIRNCHLAFLVLTICAIVLLLNSFSFPGFLTDKMFFILFIASGMFLFGLYRNKSKLIRSYYAFYFFLPFLLLVGLLVPRLQFITAVAGVGMLIDGESSRYPIDKTYSLQISRVGVLSGSPTYSLIEKKFVFFEKVTDDIVPKIGLPKSLQVSKIGKMYLHPKCTTKDLIRQ